MRVRSRLRLQFSFIDFRHRWIKCAHLKSYARGTFKIFWDMLEGVWRIFTYNYCAQFFFKLYVYYTTHRCFPINITWNKTRNNNNIDRRHQFSISSYGWVWCLSGVFKSKLIRESRTPDRHHKEKDGGIQITYSSNCLYI